ncbi:hypothetical protein P308_11700 [Pseudomonas piscis]|nr:hypothetical protein P308_11700 [Pseudomonas piscis]
MIYTSPRSRLTQFYMFGDSFLNLWLCIFEMLGYHRKFVLIDFI